MQKFGWHLRAIAQLSRAISSQLRHVYGRVRVHVYRCTQTVYTTVYTTVARVHGRCTEVYGPSTRPKTATCTAVYTAHGTRPYTARTRTCTCTRPRTGRVNCPYTAVYAARTQQCDAVYTCTRVVYTAVPGRYTSGRAQAVYTVVYMAMHTARIRCTRLVRDRVHGRATVVCTCRPICVHGL